ncbi:hypothetical protein ACFFK0_15530 [Paenibacillus chartarius]|uniref:Pilus assembly protein TadE n=1 Tax=Paenibacillus chartarius TaxID=747481 RepID=A0ABV6DMI7_9BACL
MRLRSHELRPKQRSRLNRWLRDQSGTASLEWLVLLPFLLFFLLIGVDFMRWQITLFAVQPVAETATQAIEMRKGTDEQVLQDVARLLEQRGLDPAQWSFSVTPVEATPHPTWWVTFKTRIPFRAFALFGQDVSVPIEVTRASDFRKGHVAPGNNNEEAASAHQVSVMKEGGWHVDP